MPLNAVLNTFRSDVAQCESLIVNAHANGANSVPILPEVDRQQITVAAFLNFFIAWERFVEASLYQLMMGAPTLNGTIPVKYVSPVSLDAAIALVRGTSAYFDFANRDRLRMLIGLYFHQGYPFEPHIGSVFTELQDLRVIRNATAHIQTNTQRALDAVVARIFAGPRAGMSIYSLLTTVHPSANPPATVFSYYKEMLLATAQLIVTG